jgi:glycosyltransferase involved in cell wall biosynthesis
MHETPHAFFHLDHPVEGQPQAAGPVILRGWTAGRHGRPLVDLRMRLGENLHPAIYGFPRADLAAFFRLPGPFLPGGFEATLPLIGGEHTITFEALTISGEWHPVGTVRLTVQPAPAAPVTPPPAPPTIQPHEFARALQATLRAAAAMPVNAAAAQLAAALPHPAVIRYPHLPFHGHLHQPTLLERVLFGRVRIEGWLFHETAAIRRVVATVDLQTWQELEQAGTKPYVEAMFPQFPQVKHCRIDGLIDVPAQLPNPLCVRIYAELDDGSWHLCHVQRMHTWEQEQEKVPFMEFSRLAFARTVLALDCACRARGFAISRTGDLWRGIRGVYQEYHARARPPQATPAASPALPAGPAAASRLGLVTLITHNLGLEGAPLFLFEYARQLAAGGARLQVISAADGPLAADYARLGADVQVVDIQALNQAGTARELADAIARLGRDIHLTNSQLVVANTLSAYWGVHLARRANRPSLFYIHESTTPATFYLGHMAPATLPLIEETFRIATHVSFLTETTRVYYRPWLGAGNHSLNPGWIDVAAIDRALAAQSRDGFRRTLGLEPATRLVINVGSVCDRKGQHIFARGVDLLWRQAPELAASCRFLMVGGRDTLFDRDLQALLKQLDRPNLQIIPATPAPLPYYAAADLFVCSSYEESLPRVIMEAMAARVPILSTAVHGIRDLLVPGTHGWLIPPGHSQALSEGLQHVLTQPELLQAMSLQARARVVAEYDCSHLLPRHTALAAQVAATAVTP